MNLYIVVVAEQRHKDMQRQTERQRLVRQALAAPDKRERFYEPALIWVRERAKTFWFARTRDRRLISDLSGRLPGEGF